jgi:hypothetical protein
MLTRIPSGWLALLVCSPLFAAELPTISDPDIQACIERLMPEKSSTQTLTLRSFDESGPISESVANTYWQRSQDDRFRAVIRLTAPPSRIGLAVLVIESAEAKPRMFLYVPDLKRTRRVTGKQIAASMLGTDLSYEEFSYFQKSAVDSETKRIEDQDLDGSAAYVLETTPTTDGSPYSRVVTFVDKVQCIPVHTQFFLANGELGKELVATRAEIKQDVEIDIDLGDGIFNPKSLGMVP